jgi:Fe-S-cluster containining protein
MTRPLPILGQPTEPVPEHVAGVREQALTALWAQQAPQIYQFKNWRTVLKLQRRFNLKPATLTGLKVAIPTGKVPDCDNCLDVCCTGENAVVSLRLQDIARLLDLDQAKLLSWERPQVPASEAKKKHSWARREADGSVFHRAFPVLARDATGTCKAITEDRLCGLWPSWPLSCARYPYALDIRNNVVFYAAGCTSTRIAPMSEAPIVVRRLVRATLEAYNQRLRDVWLLALARPQLEDLGLLQWVRVDELGF